MELKKLPNSKTTEELLRQLDNDTYQDDTFEQVFVNDIHEFATVFDLKLGEEPCSAKLLFKLYRAWGGMTDKQVDFSRDMSTHFVKILNKIKINKSSREIEQIYLKIKNKKGLAKYKSRAYNNHFQEFTDRFGLKKGTFFIQTSILYMIYKDWMASKGKQVRLSLKSFGIFCKMKFIHKMPGNRVSWTGLDPYFVLNIPKDKMNAYKKEFDKQREEGRQKKEKPQKPYTIPSPETGAEFEN